MPRFRGARPSPRSKLAAAEPHIIIGDTPAQWIRKPAKLSMWLNDVDGDCVTAEEAFAKASNSTEIFIEDSTVLKWATANNFLNGANLTDVLDMMQHDGFTQGGRRYNDGPYKSVDWTNEAILRNAIVRGPVKIGIAGDQLENVVPDPPTDGWLADGLVSDPNEDHCVCLAGFGTIAWLAEQLGVTGHEGDATPAYEMFTWSSLGIITVPSMLAITGEAWLRLPVTVTEEQE